MDATAHDRRRFVVLAGTTAAAGALGAGATLLRWLRRDDEPSRAVSHAGGRPASEGPTTTDPPAPSTTAAPRGVTVEVLCREAWGAEPARVTERTHTIGVLTVHHTGTVLQRPSDTPGRIRAFQAGHQRDGFSDLAYHYVIDAQGNVYEARSTDVPGETYTDYDPTGHFLVVCDGNFEVQPVPEAQLDALARLLAWASERFGVPPSRLEGHRDAAATACPGEALYAHLQDGSLRAAIEGYLAEGQPRLVPVCGAEGAARVAAISRGTA